MLTKGINHYELYQLNVSLIDSIMTTNIDTINKIKKNNELIFYGIKDNYYSAFNKLTPSDYYRCVSEYIETHIFNKYCDKFAQYATTDDIRIFIQNYGADQVWFTQYLSALSVKAPEEAAIEIYKNLYDEVGDNFEASDTSGFHPKIFRRLYDLFDISVFNRFEMHGTVLETTYACINTFLLSIKLSYLTGAGALFVLEKTIPKQLACILERLKNLGVSYYDREFFEMHVTLDVEHAKNWWDFCIKPYINSTENLEQLLNGINLGIQARNLLWNGLYEKSSFKA